MSRALPVPSPAGARTSASVHAAQPKRVVAQARHRFVAQATTDARDVSLPPVGTPVRLAGRDMILLGLYLDGRLAFVPAADFGAYDRRPAIVAVVGMVASVPPSGPEPLRAVGATSVPKT